jgi:3-hydroxybutyryl-CoA dehydrogenase
MNKMTVVGAGTMGSGIAHVFALAGYEVQLIDVAASRLQIALQQIEKNLARQVKKDFIGQEQADTALKRIHTGTDLQASSGSAVVVEAASEEIDLKKQLFREISALVSQETILASNTSSISITEIAAVAAHPERVIGMHFFNPVPVMKLVEVIRGLATSDKTFGSVMQLSRRLGKTPVAVNDFPGFVSNRVLMPMLNEAIYCVMEGVAACEDVDNIMKLGMAHPMGPLALADLIGLDVCLHILEVLHRDLGEDKYRPCPLLRKKVAAGQLGKKSGQGFYTYN